MKKVLLIVIGMTTAMSFGQVTEMEKQSREVSKDTTDGWKKGGSASLIGSQTSLTNWVAGGQNSVSFNAGLNLYANYRKGNTTWENLFDFGYGLLRQSDQLFRDNGEKWIKTDDRINLFSKYGRKASNVWYYSALLNFRTQSTAGYAYPNDSIEISGFLAPAYLVGAIGMDYKPNDKFSAFIAPLTAKLTFVNDETLADQGAFGVTEAEKDAITGEIIAGTGKRFRSEYGAYIRSQYKTGFGPLNAAGKQHMFFTTRLDLFTNYVENPGRIDVNWETLVEIQIWKVLSLTLSTHLIYDDDIDISIVNDQGEETAFGPRVQFKEIFGAGLLYTFPAKKQDK